MCRITLPAWISQAKIATYYGFSYPKPPEWMVCAPTQMGPQLSWLSPSLHPSSSVAWEKPSKNQSHSRVGSNTGECDGFSGKPLTKPSHMEKPIKLGKQHMTPGVWLVYPMPWEMWRVFWKTNHTCNLFLGVQEWLFLWGLMRVPDGVSVTGFPENPWWEQVFDGVSLHVFGKPLTASWF